eukprot:TRINITY_DN1310_c0_g1_i5.p1 TRINITY_DN1310_c0_g1~~TRINITY_DN1310_c0_g1_i5.p1  ORF type:complete len:473 (-),score=78.83 TRINITY_DN1310_c0_g1_i5:473-1891(-)
MVWDEAKMGVTIRFSACSPPVIPQKLCPPVIPRKRHQRFIASHRFSILPRTSIHRLFPILQPLKSTQSYSLPDAMATPLTPASADEDDVSEQALILDPVKEEGLNVLVLFFPGALTPPAAYYPLIQLVQSRSSFRIWCVILDPGEKYLSEKMIEASIGGMIQRAKQHGFTPGELSISNVFFAAHSIGSWFARTAAKKRGAGFIQMGCSFYPRVPDNLVQYPKPTLTLSGGLDGQLKVAVMAAHSYDILIAEELLGSYNTVAVKPVIVIPGMNHAQFSHGIPNRERGDLDPDISIEEARSQTADYIAAFIALHVEGLSENQDAALQILKRGVDHTHKMYKAFGESLKIQETKIQETHVKKFQLQVAGLQDITEENVVVMRHDYLDNFIYSKPWIDTSLKRIVVHVYFAPADKSECVKNLWVKMKSSEAIHKAFGKHNAENKLEVLSAKELNSKIFQQAISLMPEEALNKFYER